MIVQTGQQLLGRFSEGSRDFRRRAKTRRESITRVYNLLKFPFTALELAKDVNEEQVAEVFVRINSKGKPLNRADFILTLMSVFWDEGRNRTGTVLPASADTKLGWAVPFNHYIRRTPINFFVSASASDSSAHDSNMCTQSASKDLETEQFSEGATNTANSPF